MDIVSAILGFVLAFGAPVLVALFYAEGLAVGKVLQPPAIFIAYVAVASPSPGWLAAIVAGCVIAATLGQLTLFRGFDEDAAEWFGVRRRVPYVDRVPGWVQGKVGERRLAIVERGFERYGGLGICLSNAIPGIRGLMAIPAGLSSYPQGRFVLVSTAGNLLYMLLLVAAARGLLGLARVFGVG